MEPDPTFIDVGILYLFGLGAATALIVMGVNLVRRFSTTGFAGVWRSLRYTAIGLSLTIAAGGIAIGVLLVLAYAIGWIVHLLGWWPY
ncbi:hypothetical protein PAPPERLAPAPP_04780 [Brevundimonas phage vB_BpoS-Papperlapapp]|uniref:Uncharacterized protein n=2 Tax=Marchewkavirus TaxID=3425052 RepID=A0A9E7MQT7_9CAUD|nr:hypothetical protein KABACHOK_03160 [Brevundimonas phage vB_BpoS-Kabachok]USN14847.1 hypothetical protein DOMOVOI_03730 [Brevundimonas phage vB_BpoS-Domovoi]USN16219.1 hypothetical protein PAPPERLAPAPP_04780 [Brevundimonas phage vB_BpoS-Papperlapapp]